MFRLSMNEKFMVKKEGPLPEEVDHIAGGIGHDGLIRRHSRDFFQFGYRQFNKKQVWGKLKTA